VADSLIAQVEQAFSDEALQARQGPLLRQPIRPDTEWYLSRTVALEIVRPILDAAERETADARNADLDFAALEATLAEERLALAAAEARAQQAEQERQAALDALASYRSDEHDWIVEGPAEGHCKTCGTFERSPRAPVPCSLVREWQQADADLAASRQEVERLRALRPIIHESLTNDTLRDDPGVVGDDYPCECEDCGRLRIDALRQVWAALAEPSR
jgi:hypothetical protein